MKTIALYLVALGAPMMLPVVGWADSGCGPNGFPNGGECLISSGGSAFLQTTQFPASTTIPIQGFNPALGTLVDVGVELSAQGSMTLDFLNPGPFSDPGDGGKGAMFVDVSTPSGSDLVSGAIEFHGISAGPLDPGMSTTKTFDDGDIFGSFIQSQSVLAEFTKSGTILLPAFLGSPSLPLFTDIVTLDSGTMRFGLSVEYDYTQAQVPEPESAIPVITVLVVVGMVQVRRHRPGKPRDPITAQPNNDRADAV